MDNTQNYWVMQAYRYALQHPSILTVSEPVTGEDDLYSFTANFNVNLPGRLDLIGETPKGVRKVETVVFLFPGNFPYKAPKIFLRDDFNRDFPHINPAVEKVCPCVYEGKLDELLQQPKWFDGILDQVVDWLEKAAEDNLISVEQGWEPMRMDDLNGFISYNSEELVKRLNLSSNLLSCYVLYNQAKDFFLGSVVDYKNDRLLEQKEITIAKACCTKHDTTCDKYIPNFINNFSDLCLLADKLNIDNFREKIDEVMPTLKRYNKSILFVTLAARRPIKIINQSNNIELLNFAVKVKSNKKNRRIHLKSPVYSLVHIENCSPSLLKRFSGVKVDSVKTIVQLGCGSLGSKIAIHLARNGNEKFILVDNDYYLPHNNSRHGLIDPGGLEKKTKVVAKALNRMGITVTDTYNEVYEAAKNIKHKALYIDSTASIAVRNLLSQTDISGSVVNTSLYNGGRLAVLVAEAPDRNPRVDDLVTLLYSECLRDNELAKSFLSEQAVLMSTGQGCGSYTTIAPDSRISLSAAGIAAKIQYYLSNDIPKNGELLLGIIEENDMGMSWKKLNSGKVIILPARGQEDWEVRLQPGVLLEMERCSHDKVPNEIGGVLIGFISLINRVITVTDLLPAPDDSISTPTYFKLGTKGLKEKVIEVEKKTNGLLTYLGTWHSHPYGGKASSTDNNTKTKLLVLRDYEPTICLIWTPNGVIRV